MLGQKDKESLERQLTLYEGWLKATEGCSHNADTIQGLEKIIQDLKDKLKAISEKTSS